MRNTHGQATTPRSWAVTNAPMAPPTDMHAWSTPAANARRRSGIHTDRARVDAGKSPAWAIPINTRARRRMTNPVAESTHRVPALIATVTAPSNPNRVSARRGPQRSTNSPVGIWKRAYAQKNAPMAQPVWRVDRPRSSRAVLSTTLRQPRWTYASPAARQRPKRTTYRTLVGRTPIGPPGR